MSEALIKLAIKQRDGAALQLDAWTEFLESLAPVEVKEDFDKLPWEQKKGEKGPFEQTSEKATQNSDLWKALKAKLKENKGFCQHDGFKYWNDLGLETVIDRRKIV